jgi:hypothetical protein
MVLLIIVALAGCAAMRATRIIRPEIGQDETALLMTNGVAATKGNISVVVSPLENVKELDGFGIMIINESSNWVSFKKEDFVLIQDGVASKPVSDTQVATRLGGSYKPEMPTGINTDIFQWRRNVNNMSSHGLRIVDEEKSLSVMGGSKEKIFVFFNTRDSTAPLQLIIPNIYNEKTKERTRFSFRFTIEKR